jgi:hypothetical protein
VAGGADRSVLREDVVGWGRLSFVIETVAEGSTALGGFPVQDRGCRAVCEADGDNQTRGSARPLPPIQALRGHCGLLRSGGPNFGQPVHRGRRDLVDVPAEVQAERSAQGLASLVGGDRGRGWAGHVVRGPRTPAVLPDRVASHPSAAAAGCLPYAVGRYHPRSGDVRGGRWLYGEQSQQGRRQRWRRFREEARRLWQRARDRGIGAAVDRSRTGRPQGAGGGRGRWRRGLRH